MTLRVDFTSQEYLRDPAAALRALRASGPVVQTRFPIIGKVWITTTQEMAGRVLKDSHTFTLRKDGGGPAGLRWWMPPTLRSLANNMLTVDEPDHTRLRQIVDEAFRRRAILEMEPRILALADELAGELFAEGSPADLVERYLRTARTAARRQTEVHRLGEPGRPRRWAGRPHPHGRRLMEHEALPGAAPGRLPANRW